MKKPHFFKAYCRIGLTNPPFRQKDPNIGVELSSDAILTQSFLKQFKEYEIDEFTFTRPEEINDSDYWRILAKELSDFKSLINKKIKTEDEIQVMIGGENSTTFSSFLALIERVEDIKKVGFFQLDSHGEINSNQGSISKNFHGMYMRPFFDNFDIPEIDSLVPNKLPIENIMFIGAHDIDPDEIKFIDKTGLRIIARGEYSKNQQKLLNDIKDFISRFEYLHINFDIDIFDKSIAPATGIPTENGFLLYEIFPIVELLSEHPKLSLDITEVNPKKDIENKTVKLAQEILSLTLNP